MAALCSICKESNDRTPYRYCKKCHNSYMVSNRRKYKELTPEQKLKANARSYAKVYLSRGKIEKGLCITCGDSNVEMHHSDYNKPIDITWLCRKCHLNHHMNI